MKTLKAGLSSGFSQPGQLNAGLAAIRQLSRIAPQKTLDRLLPLLLRLPPLMQLASLQAMLYQARTYPLTAERRETSLQRVAVLIAPTTPPEVVAAALRYRLTLDPPTEVATLLPYLQPEQPAPVRAVAAATLLGLEPASSPSDRLAQFQAQRVLQEMLTHRSEQERLAASEVLGELPQLPRFKAQIPALLEDFSPAVRRATLQAIAQQAAPRMPPGTAAPAALYPYLLKALQNPLTEAPAQAALLTMGDEAIAPLRRCTQHPSLSAEAKRRCWTVLAQLNSARARQVLVENLTQTSGRLRQHLLKLLLAQPNRLGISALEQALSGPQGIMLLLKEELWLQEHLYGGLVDLAPQRLGQRPEVWALRRALVAQQRDGGERILLLLQVLCPQGDFARIGRDLRDRATIPQGLKRLNACLSPALRPAILPLFAAQPVAQKLEALVAHNPGEGSPWRSNRPLTPTQGLAALLALQPGLESDTLTCAYQLASALGIRLSHGSVLAGLSHADEAVRAAVNLYLERMTSSVLQHLSPGMLT